MIFEATHNIQTSTQAISWLQAILKPKSTLEDALIKMGTKQFEKYTQLIIEDIPQLKAMPHSQEFVTMEKFLAPITDLLNNFSEELQQQQNARLFTYKLAFDAYLKAWNELYSVVDAKADHHTLSAGVKRMNQRKRPLKTL